MELNVRQTRQLLLAGTVPLPRPFPTVGVIWFREGKLSYGPERKEVPQEFLMIEEPTRGEKSTTRGVLLRDVSALFIPGRMRDDGSFCISRRRYARDLERGSWFLSADVNPDAIVGRLKLPRDADLATSQSILRGIAFVAEAAPLVTETQTITTAGEVLGYRRPYCTCEF